MRTLGLIFRCCVLGIGLAVELLRCLFGRG